jgi:hypothetical protein
LEIAARRAANAAARRDAPAPAAAADDDAAAQAKARAERVVGQFLSELRRPGPEEDNSSSSIARVGALAEIARSYQGPHPADILWANAKTWCETVFEVCCDALSAEAMEAFLLELRQESPDLISRQGPSKGRTLLHLAAGRRAPLAVVKLLVRWNRGALEVGDDDGQLPLHHACGYYDNRPLDLALLEFLMLEHPPALRVPCRSGRLPLHHVIHRMFRPLPNVLESTRMVLDAYPEALVAGDMIGMTPVMVGLLGFPALGEPEPSPQALELLRSMVRRAGPASVRTFESARKFGVAKKFAIDDTALDHAYRYCPKPSVIEIVVDAWPAVLYLKEIGKWAKECPEGLREYVGGESHAVFLALVEVLLHETTSDAVPGSIRRSARQALEGFVPTGEAAGSSSLAAVRAIQKHVQGQDRQRELRRVVLDNSELQEFLQGAGAIQDLVAGLYRMNKAGRLRVEGSSGSSKEQRHAVVLQGAIDDPSCLFLHLRECDDILAGTLKKRSRAV